MRTNKAIRIGIVIVSYGHQKDIAKLLIRLTPQLTKDDKVVVVDNHPDHATYNSLKESEAVIIAKQDNNGFAAGCNYGVSLVRDEVDVVFLLNPDAVPDDGVLTAIRKVDFNNYAACMPLLVLPDKTINSAGNIVHTTGLSWCDKLYKPIEDAKEVVEIDDISGACAAISVEWWDKLGGMDEAYFMYYEDTDLSAMIRSRGGKILLLHDVYVTHDYEFSKGNHKWIYIERNIPLFIIKNWPLSIILLFLAQNLVIGAGLWLVAIIQRRFLLKVRSTMYFFRALPTFLRARRQAQRQRTVTSYEFLMTLHPRIDTPLLQGPLSSRLINSLFVLNYRLAKSFLKVARL